MKLSEEKMKVLRSIINEAGVGRFNPAMAQAQAAVDFLSAEWTREPSEEEVEELADKFKGHWNRCYLHIHPNVIMKDLAQLAFAYIRAPKPALVIDRGTLAKEFRVIVRQHWDSSDGSLRLVAAADTLADHAIKRLGPQPAASREDEIRELADLAYERLTGTQPELQRLREENEALKKEHTEATASIRILMDENEALKAELASRPSQTDVAAIVRSAVEKADYEDIGLLSPGKWSPQTTKEILFTFAGWYTDSLAPKPSLKPCPYPVCPNSIPTRQSEAGTYWVWCMGCNMHGPEADTVEDGDDAWNAMPRKE